MKKRITKKCIALALLFTLLASALAGCGPDAAEEGSVIKLGVTGAVYEECVEADR